MLSSATLAFLFPLVFGISSNEQLDGLEAGEGEGEGGKTVGEALSLSCGGWGGSSGGGDGETGAVGYFKPFAILESMALMNPIDSNLLSGCLRNSRNCDSDMVWGAGCGSMGSCRGDRELRIAPSSASVVLVLDGSGGHGTLGMISLSQQLRRRIPLHLRELRRPFPEWSSESVFSCILLYRLLNSGG